MPTPASSRAAVVVTMMITISFCLIGMSRKLRMADASISPPTFATLNSLELSFSPAFSAAALIDVEPHAAVFDHEGDHAAVADKSFLLRRQSELPAPSRGEFWRLPFPAC